MLDLNEIVDSFIKDNDVYIKYLPSINNLGKVIFNEQINVLEKKWSRTFSLNESIQICFNFLKTIDKDLANEFKNTIKSLDSDNLPYVNFISKEEYPNSSSHITKKRVYIYYDNSPYDVYTILHELIHKLNDYEYVVDDIKTVESFEKLYFGETVSMLGEEMLGKYMLENNFINENDYSYRKYLRLNNVKECIKDIIVENELINMRKKSLDINYDNCLNILNNYSKDSIEYKILNDEKNNLIRIRNILEKKELSFPVSQRYILGYALCEQLSSNKDINEIFKIIHNEIGSIDSNIKDIMIGILKNYEDTKKSR